jgi:hypothetical protein
MKWLWRLLFENRRQAPDANPNPIEASSCWKVLGRNKNASSTKQDVVMEFCGRPPIGQKQGRPMDGAQFHPP